MEYNRVDLCETLKVYYGFWGVVINSQTSGHMKMFSPIFLLSNICSSFVYLFVCFLFLCFFLYHISPVGCQEKYVPNEAKITLNVLIRRFKNACIGQELS